MRSFIRARDDCRGCHCSFGKQLESLQAVDEGVAQLMNAVEATGQADNTIVIFTSDNGVCWEEHRWNSKECEFEECLRVPLLIRALQLVAAPRKGPGSALNIDLAPTIAALAGATLSSAIDGQSLVPVLAGRIASVHADVLFEYFAPQIAAIPTYVGVRGLRWKHDEYAVAQGLELYDLISDPFELQNLAQDPAYANVILDQRARLTALSAPQH